MVYFGKFRKKTKFCGTFVNFKSFFRKFPQKDNYRTIQSLAIKPPLSANNYIFVFWARNWRLESNSSAQCIVLQTSAWAGLLRGFLSNENRQCRSRFVFSFRLGCRLMLFRSFFRFQRLDRFSSKRRSHGQFWYDCLL